MKPRLAFDHHRSTDIRKLRDRIDELEAVLGVNTPVRFFNLTQLETNIVNMIASRVSIHREALFLAIYGGESEVEPKILDVWVCKIRKKLPPEITITTLWGRGFTMPLESRELWRKLYTEALNAHSP